MDPRSVDRLLLRIQRLADPLDDEGGHRTVDMASELDEAALEPILSRLPRQIKRIDRNAVAAETRSRVERHEAEWFGACGLDHFPYVDVHPVGHQRDFVD